MSEAGDSSSVRFATADEIARLEPLWIELYDHQSQHGMLLSLPPTAFDAWTKSIVPSLGRFAVVVVGEQGGKIVGFVAGRIRALPPYFGSGAIGTISEVYVRPQYRSAGIGRRLLARAVDWFSHQQIRRIELQVVAGNPAAVHFYEQLGWHKELVQMVWTAPPQ
jgi:ribosomal protein S18 acetylase RimI-like enzyme